MRSDRGGLLPSPDDETASPGSGSRSSRPQHGLASFLLIGLLVATVGASEALIAQVDAYAAGDYAGSVTLVGVSFGHLFTVADALADAAAQLPDRFGDVARIAPTPSAGHRLPAAGIWPWALVLVLAGPAALVAYVPGARSRGRRST